MGDAPDSFVVILFVPLLFTPLYAAPKLLLLRLGFFGTDRPVWRRLVAAAAAESCLPLVVVIASTPFYFLVGVLWPAILHERWFRIGSTLLMLLLACSAANGFVTAGPRRPASVLRALLLGSISTVVFIGAWLLIGHHLRQV